MIVNCFEEMLNEITLRIEKYLSVVKFLHVTLEVETIY